MTTPEPRSDQLVPGLWGQDIAEALAPRPARNQPLRGFEAGCSEIVHDIVEEWLVRDNCRIALQPGLSPKAIATAQTTADGASAETPRGAAPTWWAAEIDPVRASIDHIVNLPGSSILRMEDGAVQSETTLFDELALAATVHRPFHPE